MRLAVMTPREQRVREREQARARRILTVARRAQRKVWDSMSPEQQAQIARERPWTVPDAEERRPA